MPKITLLLDLDDTLLDTNMEAFIPAYFSALSASLADVVAPEVMLPALMGGTKRMMTSEDPAQTLREVFDAHFFPKLGSDRTALDSRINRFYDDVFPSLQHVTKPRPEAVDFVDWAFGAGHRVAVATNPYFPLKAVQHRMRWAGLPPEKYPFALVSSYETFHFTKETGAYFLEFLGHLGWPEGPVVMVGNDLTMDLLPAQHAGLPVFWMREGKEESQPGIPQGTFDYAPASDKHAGLYPSRTARHTSCAFHANGIPACQNLVPVSDPR
jgi:FMN phosphatase YigB (HAD superfamily)